MDLAKIRKKSLQMLKELGDAHVPSPPSAAGPIKFLLETAPAAPVEWDFFHTESGSTTGNTAPGGAAPTAATFPESTPAPCSPLELILAGRKAAGCDKEAMVSDDVAPEAVVRSGLEFLCTRVSTELYAINIMDIKEIITPREVTEVPHAPAFVSGIISLRGTIIPIIDMRRRLGLTCGEPAGKERIVVIRTGTTLSGLLVDEVLRVVPLPPDAVEAAPAVLDGIDRDFVSGLGRSDGRLMILLNLENVADIALCQGDVKQPGM